MVIELSSVAILKFGGEAQAPSAISKYLQNAFAILICSGVRHSGSNSAGEHIFFVWPGRSHVRMFARHRRAKGVALTRLPDLGRRRPSIRCDILSQVRSIFTAPSRARDIDRKRLPFSSARAF
jgi:hypothetical protein